jgi:rhamnosyltransferase
MKICSVTILYNPTNAVADYIASYAPLVNHSYVIENSNTHLPSLSSLIAQKTGDDKIEFIKNKENLGVAAALNIACSLADSAGFDWILTMDQDSYFDDATFFNLAKPLLAQQNIGIISASYYGKLPYKKNYSAGFDRLLIALTSGNLVHIQAWKKVNGFTEKLFIDEVDNDFCIRLKKANLLVLGSKQVFLHHSLGQQFSIKPFFAKKSFQIGIHPPFRMYYTVRNGLFVSFKYLFFCPYFSINRWKNLSTKLILIIFFYPHKRKYLYNFLKALAHFITFNYKNDTSKNKNVIKR